MGSAATSEGTAPRSNIATGNVLVVFDANSHHPDPLLVLSGDSVTDKVKAAICRFFESRLKAKSVGKEPQRPAVVIEKTKMEGYTDPSSKIYDVTLEGTIQYDEFPGVVSFTNRIKIVVVQYTNLTILASGAAE